MAQLATDQASADANLTADQITTEHVERVVEDLFVSMFSMEVSPEENREIIPSEGSLEASVQIEGPLQLEVRVVAPRELSEAIARAMFETEQDALTEDETRDAIGEVANVVGGNIKGLVDHETCTLTTPTVGAFTEIPTDARCELFRCRDSVFHIVLIAG